MSALDLISFLGSDSTADSGGGGEGAAASGAEEVRLHLTFSEQLMSALHGGEEDMEKAGASRRLGADKYAPSLAQLEAYGWTTWQAFMMTVLSPPDQPVPLTLHGETVQSLLDAAGAAPRPPTRRVAVGS